MEKTKLFDRQRYVVTTIPKHVCECVSVPLWKCLLSISIFWCVRVLLAHTNYVGDLWYLCLSSLFSSLGTQVVRFDLFLLCSSKMLSSRSTESERHQLVNFVIFFSLISLSYKTAYVSLVFGLFAFSLDVLSLCIHPSIYLCAVECQCVACIQFLLGMPKKSKRRCACAWFGRVALGPLVKLV